MNDSVIRKSAALVLIVFLMLFAPLWPSAKEESIPDVVERVSKAIVFIDTEEVKTRANEVKSGRDVFPFLRRAGEEEAGETEAPESGQESGQGSGVILDPKGIIVTNEHVIEKAVSIKVKLWNRREHYAHVLAADPERDIALLKVDDADDLPFLKVQPREVRVGERAIVIGSPIELTTSVMTGVVSAFRKNVKITNRIYGNFIQTDAAINPGNSGGPLLDGKGNLIGIVTAVVENARGIGFAIPIDDVMSMLSEFLVHPPRRPVLGVFFENGEDDDGHYLYVNRVIPGSPAEKSGLRVGDRIIELDGKKIREGMKIHNNFRRAAAGGKNQLKVQRGSQVLSANVGDANDFMPIPLDESICGLRLSDIRGYAKMKYKVRDKNGAVVTKVYKGGIGERYGLKAGDVVLKINNAEVINRNAFQILMMEGLKRNYVLYQVRRNDTIFFLPVKFDTLL
jgi:serine protease Do